MPSISTKRAIIKRLQDTCESKAFDECNSESEIMYFLKAYMKIEYDLIPEKERIGKGSVFIAKSIAEMCLKKLIEKEITVFDFTNKLVDKGDEEQDCNLYNLGLALFGHHMSNSLLNLCDGFKLLPKYANHANWEIREMASYSIRLSINAFRTETISFLQELVKHENPNLRRLVSESLRPLRDLIWLRDPEENGFLIDLLSKLRADPSEYVRKSVGNNLKDLSKYMPEEILRHLLKWIKEERIVVTEDLASKSKSQLGQRAFHVVWTLKHALRWVRKRNPEYRHLVEKIVGKNYVLYFNEKSNKLAIPS